MSSKPPIVELSPLKFLAGCAVLAAGLFAWGVNHPFPPWVVALEVLVTIVALFVFGSIRYRLDKNALTYGAALVIVATFWNGWWESSALRADIREQGSRAFVEFVRENFFTRPLKLPGMSRMSWKRLRNGTESRLQLSSKKANT